MIGGELVTRTLEELGAETVFGLPGSQNVALFEALRTSRLRTIVAVHELGASFMANGYARASGRPGILATIPGPGFTYALTGIAEALLDSTPVVYLLGGPAPAPGRRYQLQRLDQRAAIAPLVKEIFEVRSAEELPAAVRAAYAACRRGEPGPVVVEIGAGLLAAETAVDADAAAASRGASAAPDFGELVARWRTARRPLFYVGQGAFEGARELRLLAETGRAPVVTTTSARGVVSEDHPAVIVFDRRRTEVLNELAAEADLVLAIGCKFSHNGSHGFRLSLRPEALAHVDASAEVLGANYDAAIAIQGDGAGALRALLAARREPSLWTEEELAAWKAKAAAAVSGGAEPRVRGLRPPTMERFFDTLRRAMPRESTLVLDSGLHQMLARRHFSVLCPRGLVLPTDLQSMGFAIPAAIGARLSAPGRPAVALLGDGGFAMSGLELLTAVRERIPLTAIVFNDERYGLIHKQQIGAYGHPYGTDLRNPDIAGIARAIGALHVTLSADAERELTRAIRGRDVTIVEVLLRDAGRHSFRRTPKSAAARLKNWLRQRRRPARSGV